ncbi:hypothetical protein BDN72DRAFT_522456 [Pluteus cervinus]|uniref:Uncharacterized protein n=1 Tax=Pluteus cervinus TaxID=181527 RepID=A0ACD3AYA7_9AGAR|nr:hypothetical protein BDN72DRAFT_522456 [Pluteus cervinus]
MLRTYTNSTRQSGPVRWINLTAPACQAFKQLRQPPKPSQVSQRGRVSSDTPAETTRTPEKRVELPSGYKAKRNEVGVQLLSRTLHAQIFRDTAFTPPDPTYVQIAREHLDMHGLDPKQGSILHDTGFTLPKLQGRNLVEHFHRIGTEAGEPWISQTKFFATATLPPKPDHWDIQSGWTKYHYLPDGLSYSEHVEFPVHDGKPEALLTFDVETLHKVHPYPIMACAASPNAWYAWISPWLLGQTDDPIQLIPMGDPSTPRVIVGHNVSYDRGRIKEEYHLDGTKNRFIDTMALHVAVKGISSHQRPAWMKHRKLKQTEEERAGEANQALEGFIMAIKEKEEMEEDPDEKRHLENLRIRFDQGNITFIPGFTDPASLTADADIADDPEILSQRWEDLTSANSLADVAKLHCGIDVDKAIRDDFSTKTKEEICDDITDYLSYCANDVDVTHQVFAQALPAFFKACPHPVSFSGILTMGSSFLPVNQEWEAYIARADAVYQQMEENVRRKLKTLAEEAKLLADVSEEKGQERWKDDPWLSQLDWTPKVVGKSRGAIPTFVEAESIPDPSPRPKPSPIVTTNVEQPKWFHELSADPLNPKMVERVIPLLLKLAYDGHPLLYTCKERWHFLVDGEVTRIDTSSKTLKTCQILCPRHAGFHLESGRMTSCDMELAWDMAKLKRPEGVDERVMQLARSIVDGVASTDIADDPWLSQLDWTPSPSAAPPSPTSKPQTKPKSKSKPKPLKPIPTYWPKWYWDAAKPKKDMPPGTLDITVRNRIAPILMKLSWHGCPLFHSKEHGWTFRVSPESNNNNIAAKSTTNPDGVSTPSANGGTTTTTTTTTATTPTTAPIPSTTRGTPLQFADASDSSLADSALHHGFTFYKLPHKDGEKANVGSPLGKSFMKYAIDGTLKSPGDEAKEALDLNAQCSYWISARDRICNQLVVWQDGGEGGKGGRQRRELGFVSGKGEGSELPLTALSPPHSPTTSSSSGESSSQKEKWGIILPQVITMGTVTRRAIEKTWLTASNAKSNRVGSELKAMVRAPPGYSIVGADVDSEELWISSCMGDAQFGLHGATALGWMTLEGTKAAGTDLHSKTANILGITRDQAKVFNYSRIYGAGKRHALLLLLQGNSKMTPEEAKKLAGNLYASTKGQNTHRPDVFDGKFWYGGSESYVFNKLEEIAVSDKPQTPALGCGVTDALLKSYLPTEFGEDYLPSRINWVVQSSGVDYLHLLIVSMDYLIAKYDIQARYLISVHDELRYLVKDEDRYRVALALQIANLWTRSLFAFKLGMDDLPQSVAFFSAVDVDRVLRKEVDMACVTPSHPTPIPPGESLDILGVLERTGGGTLRKDGGPMEEGRQEERWGEMPEGYIQPDCLVHRAKSAAFLRAQATRDFEEVKALAKLYSGKDYSDKGRPKRKGNSRADTSTKKRKPNLAPVGNGEGIDWTETIEMLLQAERRGVLHHHTH